MQYRASLLISRYGSSTCPMILGTATRLPGFCYPSSIRFVIVFFVLVLVACHPFAQGLRREKDEGAADGEDELIDSLGDEVRCGWRLPGPRNT